MSGLVWYMKRLRVMTWREVFHRLGEQLTLLRLYLLYRSGHRANLDGVEFKFCAATEHQLALPRFDLEALEQASASMLEGQLSVYEFTWQWRPGPDIWHRAPDTGRLWPRAFFATIPFRDGNPIGDVRKLWEVARLQQLVDLAILAREGTAERQRTALNLISAQLESWVADNPPLVGVHYISSMECALRIIAVCHALDLVRKEITGSSAWHALKSIVASHAPFIERRLSLHSSAGNHLISEAVGLVYAGILFPEFKDSKRWLATGLAVLTTESGRQVLQDGGGIEQAFGYHRYNIQLLSLTVALLTRHGIPVPTAMGGALARGMRFLEMVTADAEPFPFVGDSDSGHALSKYHLLPMANPVCRSNLETFEASGYSVARIAAAPPVALIFDHGPLGMPPGYGHGHADALAVLLRSAGQDLFVDAGTYTYTGDQSWRRYFRSTRAHNTVMIDGRDQARQDGCFLWSRPYQCSLIAAETDEAGGRLLAQHNGYQPSGARHVRGVAWRDGQWLLVWDHVAGEGGHLLELHWHLGTMPEWRDKHSFALPVGNIRLLVECAGGDVTAHCGEVNPTLGWHSSHYGVRVPITTAKVSWRGSLPHDFITVVRIGEAGADPLTEQDALQWMRARVQ